MVCPSMMLGLITGMSLIFSPRLRPKDWYLPTSPQDTMWQNTVGSGKILHKRRIPPRHYEPRDFGKSAVNLVANCWAPTDF